MLTHFNRVRRRHPRIYKNVRKVRLAQLALRHEDALANAREHSREYFRGLTAVYIGFLATGLGEGPDPRRRIMSYLFFFFFPLPLPKGLVGLWRFGFGLLPC